MSSIGSVGSSSTLWQSMQSTRSKRPDSSQMAENLFSKLDTSSQGYIEKSDLQAAFDKLSSSDSTSSSSIDDLFTQLDTNSDGKVTEQEFSDTLRQVSEQLDNQFASMRMQGGMPPPPSGGQSSDGGFTKDELTSQLSDIGSSDSTQSSLISDLVSNFDQADTDGNGMVSFQEAMAYDKASQTSSSTSTSTSTSSSDSTSTTSTSSSSEVSNKLLAQIMRLMQAYGTGGDTSTTLSSTISVSA